MLVSDIIYIWSCLVVYSDIIGGLQAEVYIVIG